MNKVAICLASYNGQAFILEQLESIIHQKSSDLQLLISDDGSTDSTIDIVKEFIIRNPKKKIELIHGPQAGFAANFIQLLKIADADYIFFSDQDDIWLDNKVAKYLEILPLANEPALAVARTRLIDRNGVYIGFSPTMKKSPSFPNSLVQSIAGGNTMAMTRSARDIILNANVEPHKLVSHDWWFFYLDHDRGGCD